MFKYFVVVREPDGSITESPRFKSVFEATDWIEKECVPREDEVFWKTMMEDDCGHKYEFHC